MLDGRIGLEHTSLDLIKKFGESLQELVVQESPCLSCPWMCDVRKVSGIIKHVSNELH